MVFQLVNQIYKQWRLGLPGIISGCSNSLIPEHTSLGYMPVVLGLLATFRPTKACWHGQHKILQVIWRKVALSNFSGGVKCKHSNRICFTLSWQFFVTFLGWFFVTLSKVKWPSNRGCLKGTAVGKIFPTLLRSLAFWYAARCSTIDLRLISFLGDGCFHGHLKCLKKRK